MTSKRIIEESKKGGSTIQKEIEKKLEVMLHSVNSIETKLLHSRTINNNFII